MGSNNNEQFASYAESLSRRFIIHTRSIKKEMEDAIRDLTLRLLYIFILKMLHQFIGSHYMWMFQMRMFDTKPSTWALEVKSVT